MLLMSERFTTGFHEDLRCDQVVGVRFDCPICHVKNVPTSYRVSPFDCLGVAQMGPHDWRLFTCQNCQSRFRIVDYARSQRRWEIELQPPCAKADEHLATSE
jgi:hypothetical protein